MTKDDIYNFVKVHQLAVLATVAQDNSSESALVGIAVMSNLDLVFDTMEDSRKCQNLRANPKISFVIGWENETTLQYEGQADEPSDSDLEHCKTAYFGVFPEGRDREHWPGITYFRVRPTWVRHSDYKEAEPKIVEMSL